MRESIKFAFGRNKLVPLEEMLEEGFPCLTEEMLHRDSSRAPGGMTWDCQYMWSACDDDNLFCFSASEYARRMEYARRPYLTLKKATRRTFVQDREIDMDLVYSYYEDEYYEMASWTRVVTPEGWAYCNVVNKTDDERLRMLGFERKRIDIPHRDSLSTIQIMDEVRARMRIVMKVEGWGEKQGAKDDE